MSSVGNVSQKPPVAPQAAGKPNAAQGIAKQAGKAAAGAGGGGGDEEMVSVPKALLVELAGGGGGGGAASGLPKGMGVSKLG